MRALLVVLPPPLFDFGFCVLHVEKPVQVEALASESAVERLDESVLSRLAGLDEVQANAVPAGPAVELSASELRAVIHYDLFGSTAPRYDRVEDACDPQPGDREVRLDRQAFSGQMSITANARNRRPVASMSWMKSIDQR